jgi:hypothetical protein
MSRKTPPSFEQFTRWVTTNLNGDCLAKSPAPTLLDAARAARDEVCRIASAPTFEVLQLLAASDEYDAALPELKTTRGFRISLVYDESSRTSTASIVVLVQCPPQLIRHAYGRTVYLWNGNQRFELGQFDLDGKALGTLPAGIEITRSDFAQGQVKLEEPDLPGGD